MTFTIRPLEPNTEIERYSEILGWAFAFPAKEAPVWLRNAGFDQARVISDDSALLGGLVRIPMGQWFGRKSVPMVGIAGVAVAPEARGRGAARALMTECLREIRAEGVGLSALYPATHTLYRAVGYEQAGTCYRYDVPPTALPLTKGAARVREFRESDRADLRALYADLAVQSAGWLDRGEYIWRRIEKPRGQKAHGFVVEINGVIQGYTFALQEPAGDFAYKIALTDLIAETPEATRALFSFLAEHRSLARQISWLGGPADTRLFQLPEKAYTATLKDQFMLRITHVENALLARGYPPISAELELAVHDAVLPENSGNYRLVVEAGNPRVERAGKGRLKLDERALAALYSGFLSPFELSRTDLLNGDEASLAAAEALFAGPAPHMLDGF